MASPKAALVLLAAALLVSCCYASRSAVLATGGEMKEEKGVIQSTDPAKCVWMPQCTVDKCNEYCVNNKLVGTKEGFCSFYNLAFECCCPDSPPAAATMIPISSSAKQV